MKVSFMQFCLISALSITFWLNPLLGAQEPSECPLAHKQKEEKVTTLKPQDTAPEFTLVDDKGKAHSLSDFKGKKVVVYFYPKANTHGCNAQAWDFRDMDNVYKRHNIVVLGISYDSPEELKKFRAIHNLPYILLSDKNKEVAKKYGAYQPDYPFVPKRITFLIDEHGTIFKILDKINVARHAKDILDEWGFSLEQQAP